MVVYGTGLELKFIGKKRSQIAVMFEKQQQRHSLSRVEHLTGK